jgi:hypothetical protein
MVYAQKQQLNQKKWMVTIYHQINTAEVICMNTQIVEELSTRMGMNVVNMSNLHTREIFAGL